MKASKFFFLLIRYRNLDANFFKPHQMKRYYEGGTPESLAQMVKLSEERSLQYGEFYLQVLFIYDDFFF
jgi:hypothetical protein